MYFYGEMREMFNIRHIIFIQFQPATKLEQGNIFRSVCQEFCPQRGGVSRPTLTGEVEGSDKGGGVFRPTPGGEGWVYPSMQ